MKFSQFIVIRAAHRSKLHGAQLAVPLDDEPVKIDLWDDVVMGAVRVVRRTFAVALPGTATSFVRGTSRVAVEFAARFLYMDRQARDEPPLADIPVVTPRGGGYGLYFDLREGDPVVTVACDAPVRGFYESGQVVTPQFPQGHDRGCSVAFPGGRVSSTESPTAPPNDPGTIFLGADDGSACIVLRGLAIASPTDLGSVIISADGPTASIQIGSDTAAIPPACAPQVLANLQALNNAIQAWVPVPNDGGASLKAVFAAWVAGLQNMADAKTRLDGP